MAWFAVVVLAGNTQGLAGLPENLPEKLASGEILAVPTYECCSIYIGHGQPGAKSAVQYRRQGSAEWRAAYPLVEAPRYPKPTDIMDHTYRGSIVHLEEGTDYEAQVTLTDADGKQTRRTVSFRTWSSQVRIARTIDATKLFSKPPFVVELEGSENGWIRILGDGKTVLDAGVDVTAALTVKRARYVILENIVLKGGNRHGIVVEDSSDVRVLNCDISGYGTRGTQDFTRERHPGLYAGPDGKAIGSQEGVFVLRSGRLTVERCYIHDPRSTSQAWYHSHPGGPHAMVCQESKGAIVVRYNDFIGSDEHRWDDCITGWSNQSPRGSFFRDSDIYGNMFAFGNDDGIELDGGQMNCRVFANRFEGFLMGVGTDPTVLGPSYVFRNLIVNLGDEEGRQAAAFKNSSQLRQNGLGTAFFFHNTAYINGAGLRIFRDVTRNNVLHLVPQGTRSAAGARTTEGRNGPIRYPDVVVQPGFGPPYDFDYDLWYTSDKIALQKSLARGAQRHGVFDAPAFVAIEHCDFRLQAGSPGIDRGENLPNFSDGYTGAAPDMGVFEVGAKSGVMPTRPIPLTADTTELRFKTSQLGQSEEKLAVAVSVPSGAHYERKFSIRKNKVFGWMRVEPAQGVLRSGESVRLTVSLDHGAIAKAADYKGLFLVKLEDGHSLPVSVYARVADNRHHQAAEAERLSGDQFKIVNDAGASAGKYVELNDDATKGFDYTFEVPRDGYYFACLRVKDATGRRQPASNSAFDRNTIFVELDGARHIVGLRSRLTNEWEWNPLQVVSARPLQVGKHTLRIIPREPVDVDRIAISSDPFDFDAKN